MVGSVMATAYGTNGNDSMSGTSNSDTIAAQDGNDNIWANDGNDTLYGGAGNDTIAGGNDSDLIYGGDGSDVIYGGDDSDPDIIYGGAGDDRIHTSNGDGNGVAAGSGNDTVYGGDNDDVIYGESGNDTLHGKNGDDAMSGGAGSDMIYAGSGNDLIRGEEGDDTLYGGDGDDTFELMDTSDDDSIFGGNGHDTLHFKAPSDVSITYDMGSQTGSYTQSGGGSTGRFDSIEEIQTDRGDDTIDVSENISAVTISAGSGNDVVTGGQGNDEITTGRGEDTIGIEQGGGNDVVTDFDISDADADGQYNDQLDVSGLQNPDGSPITVSDVIVTDDGSGNAKLTFPEGESLVLQGVTPAQMSTGAQLHAAGIPCFTPGAMIATPNGERAIETLRAGDRVMTRDHGLQAIRWIGQRAVPAEGKLAPILIRPGVVTGLEKPLLVSPQHRMLFTGYRAELLFGETEVLLAAKHLVDGRDVTREEGGDVTYIHMLFDTHEVVYANGAATESFHPGEEGVASVDDAARAELFDIFPQLRSDLNQYGQTARRCLRKHEAQMVRM
jgi:hypothetical protein